MDSQKDKYQIVDRSIICARMRAAGIKPSLQRIAVLEYLCSRYNHPTADMIYAGLHPQMPTLSKTTVYNTLRLFCQAGLATSLSIDCQNQRFDGHLHPHHHFICTRCGKVADVPGQGKEAFPEWPGYEIERSEVSYFGICPDCRNEPDADNPHKK